MPVEVELYRFQNPDGTEQDWAYPKRPSPTALTVYYGRTGSALRQSETPAHQCEQGSPLREAARRVGEKIAKGYVWLGEFVLADNRRTLTPVALAPDVETVSVSPEDSTPPLWYWLRSEHDDGTATREAACQQAGQRLARVGWQVPGSAPEDSGTRLWALVAQGYPGGVVPLESTHRAVIAFLLLLAQQGIVELADEESRLVTRWPSSLPIAVETLEDLGLQPKTVRQLLAAGDGDDWFF